jgi:hypothetical protein
VIVKEATGASGGLTLERIKEIQEMTSTQAKISLKNVRDKLIWFRHQVDKNTVDFTQGCNEIKISRENLIQDSLRHFLDLKDIRKVLFTFKS